VFPELILPPEVKACWLKGLGNVPENKLTSFAPPKPIFARHAPPSPTMRRTKAVPVRH
jgi:hypothetical protein